MVNLLGKLYHIGLKSRAMKKWSDRFRIAHDGQKNWYLRELITQIKSLLSLVSGNDIVEMLKDVLSEKQRDQLSLPKYKDCLVHLVRSKLYDEYRNSCE